MFIGRRKELDAMQSLYDKDGFGMMVIYGRRRIGKSTLINEFIKNKNEESCYEKIREQKYSLCSVGHLVCGDSFFGWIQP